MIAPMPLVAFGFGLLSVLSPCILPVIPLIAAYSTKSSKLVPVMMGIGLSISFAMMGIFASAFGSVFQHYRLMLQVAGGVLIIFLGLCMMFSGLERKIGSLIPAKGFTGRIHMDETGKAGGLMLGLSLGIVWTPCIGPILGAILTMVAVEGDILYGAFLLVIYSLGLVLPLLAIAYTTRFTLKPFVRYSMKIRTVSGFILVIVGSYFLYSAAYAF